MGCSDIIAFLKVRRLPSELASPPKTAGEKLSSEASRGTSADINLIGTMPMPGKIFIDTNIVIYALVQAATKAHLASNSQEIKGHLRIVNPFV